MKYLTVNNTLEILYMKLYSCFQLKSLKRSLLRLQSLIRSTNKYRKDSSQSSVCFDDSYSYNYFENKLWKESGISTNTISSTVSPRTWSRHSALLSFWQEQR